MKACILCSAFLKLNALKCGACGWDQRIPIDKQQRAERRIERSKERAEDSRSASELDPHGQPYNLAFNARRRTERDLSELLGLAKGLIADGVVNDAEVGYLRSWGTNHPEALQQWPVNHIFARLTHFYEDGRIDDAERRELKDLLAALVGGTASIVLGYEGATELPLDVPPPLMAYGPDEVYVFTGRFAYGPRHECEREVADRGACCEGNVTRRTSFLVIGTFGSRDWAHSSYGRKIQRAVELRDAGFAIRIVGEDHWASTLSMSV